MNKKVLREGKVCEFRHQRRHEDKKKMKMKNTKNNNYIQRGVLIFTSSALKVV